MNITVNDEMRTLSESVSLQQLIRDLDLVERKGIAVAVNEEVVTRANWPSRHLQDTDRITIIQATQGG
ncbi:MAG: sulfur carrier protein ThiS [Verrucomicrobiae bacterium]|nr:sulfur carrier protein ThiS [Verrucomicrobiae bacterium]